MLGKKARSNGAVTPPLDLDFSRNMEETFRTVERIGNVIFYHFYFQRVSQKNVPKKLDILAQLSLNLRHYS